MSDSAWPLHVAVYTALQADGPLAVLVGDRIHDAVPQDAAFPYVTIGDGTAIDWSTKGDGSDDGQGQDHDIIVHVWSRYNGYKETKQIQAAIYDALHQANLSLSAGTLVLLRCTFTTVMLDPDLATRHGVQRFNGLTHG